MKKDNNFLANIHYDVYDLSRQSKKRSNAKKGGIVRPNEDVNVKELPTNLFTPQWARSFYFRKLTEVPANNGKELLFEFTVPKGMTLVWTHYALFNDAFTTELSYFDVTINNNKVLKYHGDPADDFKLSLGGNASLDQAGLFEANIRILSGQTVRWYVINDDNVDVTMGVRMKGYIDNSNKTQTTRFGG